jgi:hypothetical protein
VKKNALATAITVLMGGTAAAVYLRGRHVHEEQRNIETPFGTVRLVPAIQYFRGRGIFVYFPMGIRYNKDQTRPVLEDISRRFFEATDGVFHFDQNPGSSMGGDDNIAVGLITAGRNYAAYERFHSMLENELDEDGKKKHPEFKGYFKRSDAPTMEYASNVLADIIGDLSDEHVRVLTEITEDFI